MAALSHTVARETRPSGHICTTLWRIVAAWPCAGLPAGHDIAASSIGNCGPRCNDEKSTCRLKIETCPITALACYNQKKLTIPKLPPRASETTYAHLQAHRTTALANPPCHARPCTRGTRVPHAQFTPHHWRLCHMGLY